ncbi:MAG: Dna2/Cas4 domain-containing protein [Erysipelotrichaceae bacterium]|nr:Dna2/Cas4 domain-containing protein [Erysipelotrichaceae bacterium]
MAITKTNFMRGMQCPKMLWLDKHKPSLKVIPPEVQQRLDEGNEFGDKAMAMFGPYEEMTIYKPGTTYPDTKAMVEKTKEHLKLGTSVICEAAFMDYNNYCAADILRKTDSGYDMYEVKNSPEVDDQHIKDAAFQYYIIKRNKINIGKIFVVIHGEDEENPFVPVEVTDKVKELYDWINENIWRLSKLSKQDQELQMPVGEQCNEPYECWYYGYCHPDEKQLKLTEEK